MPEAPSALVQDPAAEPSNLFVVVLNRICALVAEGRSAVVPEGTITAPVPGRIALAASASVGFPLPFPLVTSIWFAVPKI